MKIEQLKIIITRIEETSDKQGNVCLKCKGYNAFKQGGSNAFNFFSNIILYPVSQQQYDQTKERLFCQTEAKPKLGIVAYQNELLTPLNNGRIYPTLIVNRYDFQKDKLFRKDKLLNLGKEK